MTPAQRLIEKALGEAPSESLDADPIYRKMQLKALADAMAALDDGIRSLVKKIEDQYGVASYAGAEYIARGGAEEGAYKVTLSVAWPSRVARDIERMKHDNK